MAGYAPHVPTRALPPGFFDRVSRLRRVISSSVQARLTVLRDLELTLAQTLVLFHLGEREVATISELKAVVGRSQSSTSVMVDQLVSRGFVTSERSAVDGRRREVKLAEAGRDVVAQVEEARREGLSHALAEVPPDVLARFDEALAELVEALPD